MLPFLMKIKVGPSDNLSLFGSRSSFVFTDNHPKYKLSFLSEFILKYFISPTYELF